MTDKAGRYEAALLAILQGDYPRPVGKAFNPAKASKHDRCIHGVWMYEVCEGCLDTFIESVLANEGIAP